MPVSSRRLQAPAGPRGLVLNHTVEHGSSGQCAIISGFHLSPILGKPSLANSAATPNPHRPTPAVPRVPSSGAFGRRPSPRLYKSTTGRHPKPFTEAAINWEPSEATKLVIGLRLHLDIYLRVSTGETALGGASSRMRTVEYEAGPLKHPSLLPVPRFGEALGRTTRSRVAGRFPPRQDRH